MMDALSCSRPCTENYVSKPRQNKERSKPCLLIWYASLFWGTYCASSLDPNKDFNSVKWPMGMGAKKGKQATEGSRLRQKLLAAAEDATDVLDVAVLLASVVGEVPALGQSEFEYEQAIEAAQGGSSSRAPSSSKK